MRQASWKLSESEAELRATLREFCEREVAPHARDWDRNEVFPLEVVRALGALGALGVMAPERYGGAGMGLFALAAAVEEIARHDGGLGLTVASHNGLGSSHLRIFGDDAQRERYLPKLASGEWLGAWALTEAGSGSDAAALRTTAVRDGRGWVLNGSKLFITQGTRGDLFVILASTAKDQGSKGITAFLVERGAPGFSQRPMHGKLGMRSSDTGELTLEDVRVPDTQRLGAVGSGFIDAMKILDNGRVTIAALATGLLRGALEDSMRYARERCAFGQPIVEFQAIRFMLADMATSLSAAELLVERAARLAEGAIPHGHAASMAKVFASEAATRAANNAVQIHGGYGYTNEFPAERCLRDAKLCEIGEGTSEVQRMIIARGLSADRL